ncbi:MAG: sugar phosphate isomerase/epimerase family protein [Ruminiclostridium sp.]
MARPVTIFTGQWADLSLEEICKTAKEMGYDGLEIATWGQIDCHKAANDPGYVKKIKATLSKYGLVCEALGAHLTGQCVGDLWDPRLDGFAPAEHSGNPAAIRQWAIEEMKDTAKAAIAMG